MRKKILPDFIINFIMKLTNCVQTFFNFIGADTSSVLLRIQITVL